MRETTKQNLAILFITLFLAGSLYVFISYINPSVQRVKELKKEIGEEKIKLEQIQAYYKKSEELIQTYLNLGEEITKIDLSLPKDPQSAQIIAVLDKIFKDNNVIINSLSFNEGSKNDYKYLEVKVDFSSSYEVFKTISAELEKELRLIDIDKVSIKSAAPVQQQTISKTTAKSSKTAKTTKLSSPVLQFNISILTYYLPQENLEKTTSLSSF